MAIIVDPRFHAGAASDQPDGDGSILRYIAAKTPGVDYHPPTGQLGSYGRGPLGEPTFEPFHHSYVDWLVKRTEEEGAANQPRPRAAADPRTSSMPQPATRANPGGRSADGSFQLAQSESDAWRREIGKHYPHFQTDAPPPPDKTQQELLDQADRDEAWAEGLTSTADALEKGSDSLDELDPADREHLEKGGGPHPPKSTALGWAGLRSG